MIRRRRGVSVALVLVLAAAAALTVGGCARKTQPSQPSPPQPGQPSPESTPPPADAVDVPIYLVKAGNPFTLEEVRRSVSKGDGKTETAVRAALEALIAGPTPEEKSRGLAPALPRSARVLSVKLEGSTLTVDFSREIITKAPDEVAVSSTGEALALDSIKKTAFGCSQATHLKMLVEGKSSGTVDGRLVEDFWGHVGLPRVMLRDGANAGAEGAAPRSIGKPVDGLAIKSVRWSTDRTRFRLVFDLENLDGSAAAQCPVVRTSLSPSSKVMTIEVNGVREVRDARLKPGTPINLKAAPAVSLTRAVDEETGDDQMVRFALALDVNRPYTYRLYSLTGPLRVVIDVVAGDALK